MSVGLKRSKALGTVNKHFPFLYCSNNVVTCICGLFCFVPCSILPASRKMSERIWNEPVTKNERKPIEDRSRTERQVNGIIVSSDYS